MDHTGHNGIEYVDLRCTECGRLLAKEGKIPEEYEIKCVRCGAINSIFKGISEQIIITDENGLILYANSIVEKITGYSLKEVLGKKPSLWGGQMSEDFYRELWRVIKTEKNPIEVVVTNKRKDGVLYKAKLQISPVFGEEKEIKMFVGIETVIK